VSDSVGVRSQDFHLISLYNMEFSFVESPVLCALDRSCRHVGGIMRPIYLTLCSEFGIGEGVS
jgi:hypothetical protein